MQHLIQPAHKWGGRVGRYALFRGMTERAYDPFSHGVVQFGREQHYEAWLLTRFDPTTALLTNQPTEVVSCTRTKLRETATFTSIDRKGKSHYHLVLRKEEPARLKRLEGIASDNEAICKVVWEDAVRGDQPLFWRLDGLRQVATMYGNDGESLDSSILENIARGNSSRKIVHAAFPTVHEQQLDARLAHLHCKGCVVLGLQFDDFSIALTGGEP